MPTDILSSVLRKIGPRGLIDSLAAELKNSELTSLLLEVFRRRAAGISPPQLLRDYRANKYAGLAGLDVVQFMAFELELLKAAAEQGFEPLGFSPLCPLGTCSAIAAVDQNKVMSALRGTEVVADITNVMALEIAHRRQQDRRRDTTHLCATHRHVRTQVFDFPGFTPHFKVFGMVSGGRDTGGYAFEKENLERHLAYYLGVLTRQLGLAPSDIRVDLSAMAGEEQDGQWPAALYEHQSAQWPDIRFAYLQKPQEEHQYYRGLRFKVYINVRNVAYDIADGGLVNWSSQMLQDRKERMFISGLGTELLFKLQQSKAN
ncbi:MAG: hypothetical protein KDC66_18855 [Phaeodactylibacter sp.]|nr:hypothetical protein [Phaeodactylibacter sp.]MCB9273612.1 hypothetical protein [Lewinellaceae bacterium]